MIWGATHVMMTITAHIRAVVILLRRLLLVPRLYRLPPGRVKGLVRAHRLSVSIPLLDNYNGPNISPAIDGSHAFGLNPYFILEGLP